MHTLTVWDNGKQIETIGAWTGDEKQALDAALARAFDYRENVNADHEIYMETADGHLHLAMYADCAFYWFDVTDDQ